MKKFIELLREQEALTPEQAQAKQSADAAIDAQIKAIDDQIKALQDKKQTLISSKK